MPRTQLSPKATLDTLASAILLTSRKILYLQNLIRDLRVPLYQRLAANSELVAAEERLAELQQHHWMLLSQHPELFHLYLPH